MTGMTRPTQKYFHGFKPGGLMRVAEKFTARFFFTALFPEVSSTNPTISKPES